MIKSHDIVVSSPTCHCTAFAFRRGLRDLDVAIHLILRFLKMSRAHITRHLIDISPPFLIRKRIVGNPAGARARRRFLEHSVDLLQTQPFGFGHKEVRKEDAEGAGGAPDEEDFGLEIALVRVHHVRCDFADDEIPEPVGGCGQCDAFGTDWQRENLADDDPRGRAPG